MIADQDRPFIPPNQDKPSQRFSLWRLLFLGLVLLGLVWFFARQDIPFNDFVDALRSANGFVIGLGIFVIVATGVLKAIRWRNLYFPHTIRPSLKGSFDGLMLNQFVNNVIPGRFGEIARIEFIKRESNDTLGRVTTLTTIVLEKSLDLLFTLLTLLLLIQLVILPANFQNQTTSLAITTLALLSILYFAAFQANLVNQIATFVCDLLPDFIGPRLLSLITNGLESLATLRDAKAMTFQLFISTIISIFYFLTPYILFQAFNLPFSIVDAIILHIGVTIAVAVVTVPGRIGVFEASVIYILSQLGTVPEATLLSYAIIYHIVTTIPPILLGGIVALRTDWSWRKPNV